MSKTRLSAFEQSLDGRVWQPLWLADNARKLRDGEADAVLAWLDEAGEGLQSDVDSVRFFFPTETPAFDVADIRRRIEAAKDKPTKLAQIADELLRLDADIKATDDRLVEFIPDELFDSDASVEEMADYAFGVLAKKKEDVERVM